MRRGQPAMRAPAPGLSGPRARDRLAPVAQRRLGGEAPLARVVTAPVDGRERGPSLAAFGRLRQQMNAVDRTRRHAQAAAVALLRDHAVQTLAGADDGIHRTGLDALGAADAHGRIDPRPLRWRRRPALRVQRLRRTAEQRRQGRDGLLAAWRAAVQVACAGRQRLRIRPAGLVTAAPALGLRQQRVDGVGKRAHGAAF